MNLLHRNVIFSLISEIHIYIYNILENIYYFLIVLTYTFNDFD